MLVCFWFGAPDTETSLADSFIQNDWCKPRDQDIERFSNDCRKANGKVITPTNHNRTNSAMNQSEFLAITCNLLNAREKSRVQGAIGFGFASHWLKNWREVFKPVTKRSNRNRVITFDSHLKTAQSSGKISPRLHSIGCMLILISVTKCPLNTSPSLLARNTDNRGHKVSP